mmetsp:Transcript_9321/g.25294  ORF Transcript_9321/g.25294 Transcript_9321/m.25294 type:complete len:365 (-) Transcript_9321:459-1553(-)
MPAHTKRKYGTTRRALRRNVHAPWTSTRVQLGIGRRLLHFERSRHQQRHGRSLSQQRCRDFHPLRRIRSVAEHPHQTPVRECPARRQGQQFSVHVAHDLVQNLRVDEVVSDRLESPVAKPCLGLLAAHHVSDLLASGSEVLKDLQVVAYTGGEGFGFFRHPSDRLHDAIVPLAFVHVECQHVAAVDIARGDGLRGSAVVAAVIVLIRPAVHLRGKVHHGSDLRHGPFARLDAKVTVQVRHIVVDIVTVRSQIVQLGHEGSDEEGCDQIQHDGHRHQIGHDKERVHDERAGESIRVQEDLCHGRPIVHHDDVEERHESLAVAVEVVEVVQRREVHIRCQHFRVNCAAPQHHAEVNEDMHARQHEE